MAICPIPWICGPSVAMMPATIAWGGRRGAVVHRALCILHFRVQRDASPECGRSIASKHRGMKLVIFGLTVTSSWGNGHATLWRGLIRAMAGLGWSITFFERNTPYYAGTRDLDQLDGGSIVLYPDWQDIQSVAEQAMNEADVVIVTSYCPDAVSASRFAHQA